MKNNAMAIFLAAWLLFLAAHAGFNGVPPVQGAYPAGDVEKAAPVYELELVSETRSFRSEDKAGKEYAYYDYQILNLLVSNLEELSPADAAAAARNMETFNAKMADLLEEWMVHGDILRGDAERAYQRGRFVAPYYDETAVSGAVSGELVSVRVDRVSFSGGAHPVSYTTSLLFDLEVGQFIMDPTQLADDPQAFHDGTAEKLVEKAEGIRRNRDAYWQDYAEIISRWNEGVVLFDEEGMLVVYSTYELGPYAMGAVELRLSWEELAELMGPTALARLGAELPETMERDTIS